MQKLIFVLLIGSLCGCASEGGIHNSTISVNYNQLSQQYIYCIKNCVQPTKLELYTTEDLKPLQPDYVPPVMVREVHLEAHGMKKRIPKHHKRRHKRRIKRHHHKTVCKQKS